jgi:hypothetical protein
MAAPSVTLKSLNRATLERQLLLGRARMGVVPAVEHLVGLQAQAPNPPYVGLWTRLRTFRREELTRLLEERRLVRAVLMRGTIHLVSARDFPGLWAAVQPVLERSLRGSVGKQLAGLDLAAVTAAGRAVLEEAPRSRTTLGQLLRGRWPERDVRTLGAVVRALEPLVQVPPAGTWGFTRPSPLTTARTWLAGFETGAADPGVLIRRYLAAFGPATLADIQVWSGLVGLRPAAERLGLRRLRGPGGALLLDLPGAPPLPAEETPAPPRFLPEFDNLLVSHADRTRIVPAEHRATIARRNGMVPATFLVDGFVRGSWKVNRAGASAILSLTPFRRLAAGDRAALAEEGARLLAFVAPDAGSHDVRFVKLSAAGPGPPPPAPRTRPSRRPR